MSGSAAVLGSACSVTGLTLLGARLDSVERPPDALALTTGDLALRRLAPGRRPDPGDLARLRAAWTAAVLDVAGSE